MAKPMLTISSKNYSSWSLRGWLLCRFAGLDFEEKKISVAEPSIRAELLLNAPSFLVPCLTHENLRIWDTLAIGEYLNERFPKAGLLPADLAARTRCRSVSAEMHSGFFELRSALPMNLKASYPGFRVWSGAAKDIERITAIWHECIELYGGPYLFGAQRSLADAMYAPVCTRFDTYDVTLDRLCADYRDLIMGMPEMAEWIADAKTEPEEVEELEAEF